MFLTIVLPCYYHMFNHIIASAITPTITVFSASPRWRWRQVLCLEGPGQALPRRALDLRRFPKMFGYTKMDGLHGKSQSINYKWWISWKMPIYKWLISWKMPIENGWWLGVALWLWTTPIDTIRLYLGSINISWEQNGIKDIGNDHQSLNHYNT